MGPISSDKSSHKVSMAHREEPPLLRCCYSTPAQPYIRHKGNLQRLLEQAGDPGPQHLLLFRNRQLRPASSSRKPLKENTIKNAFLPSTTRHSLVHLLLTCLNLRDGKYFPQLEHSLICCGLCLSQTVLSTLCNKIKPKILLGMARLISISH